MRIPVPEWKNPKYLAAAVLGLLGFLLLVLATDGAITFAKWSHTFNIDTGGKWVAFILGAVLFVAAVAVLFRDYAASPTDDVSVGQPKIATFLFNSARSAPLWLGIRIYMGVEWMNAGYHKLDSPAWRDGTQLKGYWTNAVAIPEKGRPAISYDLWRDYINYMLNHEWYTWFAWVIAVGEFLVGVGLIVGALTAVAAFFGSLMNVSFMLSGSASTNPVLFALSIGIILAWRTAGLLGLDRVVLPMLGTPWQHKVTIGQKPSAPFTGSGTVAAPAGD